MTKEYEQNLKEPLTRDFLIEEFINENKTIKQIGEENGLSVSKVNKRLKKFGIKKPEHLKLKIPIEFRNKEALEKMYFEDKLSIVQIAEKLRVSYGAITKLFNRLEIKTSKKVRYERRRNFTDLRSLRNITRKNMNKLFKEANQQRIVKRPPCYETTKLKNCEKAIDRNVKIDKRNAAEIKTKEILQKIVGNKKVFEQIGIKIYVDEKFSTGFVPDFLLNLRVNGRYVIIEVDSEFYHSLPKIVKKDNLENKLLTSEGFIVIRIDSEEVSYENVEKCLKEAEALYRPTLIKLTREGLEKTYIEPELDNRRLKILIYNRILDEVKEADYRYNFYKNSISVSGNLHLSSSEKIYDGQ